VGQINRRRLRNQIGRNLAHFNWPNLWVLSRVTVIPLPQVFAL